MAKKGETHPIRRLSDLEEELLARSTKKVDGNGSVENDVPVRREEEALLLVVLERDDNEVEVEGDKADREADGGVGLAWNAVAHVAEALRVGDGGDGEKREGDEGEGEKDVEVEQGVQDVEVPRLSAVELGTGTGGGEEVVLDDVEGNDGELLVRGRVDEDDRDLWAKRVSRR